jgi:acyl carrier protein
VSPDDARSLLLRSITEIAPDADPASLPPEEDIREALDLDSMDMLNLVAALSDAIGTDIPDADVPRLTTIGGAVEYLSAVA